jgi:ribonuclease HI
MIPAFNSRQLEGISRDFHSQGIRAILDYLGEAKLTVAMKAARSTNQKEELSGMSIALEDLEKLIKQSRDAAEQMEAADKQEALIMKRDIITP